MVSYHFANPYTFYSPLEISTNFYPFAKTFIFLTPTSVTPNKFQSIQTGKDFYAFPFHQTNIFKQNMMVTSQPVYSFLSFVLSIPHQECSHLVLRYTSFSYSCANLDNNVFLTGLLLLQWDSFVNL